MTARSHLSKPPLRPPPFALAAALAPLASFAFVDDAQACSPVDATAACNGTWNASTGTTNDGQTYSCSGETQAGGEITWQWQPPAGTHAWVLADDSYSADIALFVQEDDCGSKATCVDSSDLDDTKQQPEVVDFIADGSMYYVTLETNTNGSAMDRMQFGCMTECSPSDSKASLTCSSDIVGDSAKGSDALDYYHCGTPNADLIQTNSEVVYTFVPQASGSVTFAISKFQKDQDLYILEGSCDPDSCIAGSTEAKTADDSVTFNAVKGTTYYIVVEAFAGTDGFNLSFGDNTGGCKEDCNDGKDNDADAKIDCADTDCAADPVCSCTTTNYYPDADKDGQGSSTATATPSCVPLAGFVPNKNDCNDKNALIFLGAPEICNNIDDDCDGTPDDGVGTVWYADTDVDTYGNPSSTKTACSQPSGYVTDNKDCNDANKNINPSIAEICDGIDQDCDKSIDEGVLNTYYQDSDKDTYGNPSVTQQACAPGSGYVTNSLDCDDTKSAIKPGANEVCDGIDNDCDALVDDKDSPVVGAPTWYQDSDTDKYGTTTATKVQCAQPAGYVADNTDCDDKNPLIFPTATETCNAIDDDCDKAIDEGIATKTWYLDSDKDNYGGSTTTANCLQPTGYVATSGDCADADPAINPGAKEICNNKDDNCAGGIDEGVQTTYYQDSDKDNYGNPSVTQGACATPPSGYVADKTDCDDKAIGVNPGAAEKCNGIDDNCINGIDENTATDAKTWYEDKDADKYGTATTTKACAQPGGYSGASGDCNDANNAIYPGAVEICDSLDNDCNSLVDDGAKATDWYLDVDKDTYGDSKGTPLNQCAQPVGYVSNKSDCLDSDKLINPAATEICDTKDNDCDGLVDDLDPSVSASNTYYKDADNDKYGVASSTTKACTVPTGYASVSGDCDDTKLAVNPGATEVCNGIDDNCAGGIDEGKLATFYLDSDKDTYGNPTNTTQACTVPAGYVADNTDCVDSDTAIHPGADESCNGKDDDCDGKIDDADTNSNFTNALTWYQDSDNDKYGNTSATKAACLAPSGYIAVSGDCADTNPAINPGAPEVCNGQDDNCDGKVDVGATNAPTWYADADKDTYGTPSSTLASCSQPPGYVASKTDCNDTVATVNPGAAEKCNAVDDNCDGAIDENTAVDAATWYDDDDSDTYGDPSDTTKACKAPSGYVADNKDCNDQVATISPAASEVCNLIDDDCDGQTDEAGATGGITQYADADGDLYGNTASSISECKIRPGYTANNTDCNDADKTIHPTAKEVPYDGIDQDCDGVDLTDVDGDGSPSEFAGGLDCDDSDAAVNPTATETADGVDEDCNGRVDDGTDWYDDDGDGYSEVGGDCDDGSRDARPGGAETCNDADDDCDGTVDEGTECYDDDGDCACELDDPLLCVGSIDDACSVLLGMDCADGDGSVNAQATEIQNNGIDDDCDGSVDAGAYDPDHDGYTESAGDCSPEDETVYPGAPEIADGRDNDCDSEFDEGTTGADDDGDGFTEDFGDCDDTDASVYTGASEDPENGVDDDCDGSIDEGGPAVDDDGDGFSEDGGDCDDFDDQVNPASTEDDNAIDDDCDGDVDEDFQDLDGDGYTGADDCDDQDGWTNPGTAEFCGDGLDNNCNGTTDDGCEGEVIVTPPGKCGCETGSGVGGLLPLIALVLGAYRRRESGRRNRNA